MPYNNAGLWLELDAFIAVVIGSEWLMGQHSNLLLSVVGALIITGMNAGILFGLSARDEPGGESGGRALRADCPVATLVYQSD